MAYIRKTTCRRPSPVCCTKLTGLLSAHEEFILFDTETTGLSPANSVIIEISALKVRSRDFEILDRLTVYIRPEQPVPPMIEELTGITNAFLSGEPTEDEVFDTIAGFFGTNTVCGAYNSGFDQAFMEALYNRHGRSFQTGREIFDVLKMAREVIPRGETENYKLSTCVTYYSPEPVENISFHNAEDDTLAMYTLFCCLYRDFLKFSPTSDSQGNLHAVIRTVQSWSGYGGRNRIYINLKSPYGTVFYDLDSASWRNKDPEVDILGMIDMELLRVDVFNRTGVSCEEELINFKGKA